MSEHTPGPWRVNKYGSIGAGECGTKPIVATVEPFFGKHGNDGDNARLIAAAPEMLAALIRVRARMQGYRLNADADAALTAVSKAIAKAEGKE